MARALISDREILTLDEFTSSLDAEAEGMIKDTIDELRAEKTIIIVTHRMSMKDLADKKIDFNIVNVVK